MTDEENEGKKRRGPFFEEEQGRRKKKRRSRKSPRSLRKKKIRKRSEKDEQKRSCRPFSFHMRNRRHPIQAPPSLRSSVVRPWLKSPPLPSQAKSLRLWLTPMVLLHLLKTTPLDHSFLLPRVYFLVSWLLLPLHLHLHLHLLHVTLLHSRLLLLLLLVLLLVLLVLLCWIIRVWIRLSSFLSLRRHSTSCVNLLIHLQKHPHLTLTMRQQQLQHSNHSTRPRPQMKQQHHHHHPLLLCAGLRHCRGTRRGRVRSHARSRKGSHEQ